MNQKKHQKHQQILKNINPKNKTMNTENTLTPENTENVQNHLSNVHSQTTNELVEKKEEYSNSLAEVHAKNPLSEKEVRNHYEAEQNSADKDEQLGNVPEELPTHLGDIAIENAEPTQDNESAK